MSSPLSEFEASLESRGVGIGRKVYHTNNYPAQYGGQQNLTTTTSCYTTPTAWQSSYNPCYPSHPNQNESLCRSEGQILIQYPNQFDQNNNVYSHKNGKYSIPNCRPRQVPPLTSTPRHDLCNGYANQYHNQYSDFSMGKPSNYSSSGLTEVLSSYAPGATTIFLDSTKPRRKILRLRNILILLVFAGLMGYCYCWSTDSEESGGGLQHKPLAAVIKPKPGSVKENVKQNIKLPEDNTIKRQVHPQSRSQPPPPPQIINVVPHKEMNDNTIKERVSSQEKYKTVIYSFDDKDRDNEAAVETSK